nr:hypothetical protein [Legionella jordanis]
MNATDCHLGHDLIGPQDIAWDIAGLETEWQLTVDESNVVQEIIFNRTGRRRTQELLSIYRVAYRAFRMGQLWMGTENSGCQTETGRFLKAATKRMQASLVLAIEDWAKSRC